MSVSRAPVLILYGGVGDAQRYRVLHLAEQLSIYGVATDVCVVAAVDGLARRLPQAELVVVQDAVAALDPERGRTLLAEWSARGIAVTTAERLLG